MDTNNENTAPMRPSGLKPPSKINISSPSKASSLFEMSESSANARGNMGPPPTMGSLKHKVAGLPESAPKRKTLAERAGETASHRIAAPPSARPVNDAVKNTAYSGFRSQFSNSTSKVPPKTGSRHIPSTSLGSSLNYGSKRPGTATSLHRSASSHNGSRPATSQSQRSASSTTPEPNQKGAVPFSISTNGEDPYILNGRKRNFSAAKFPSSLSLLPSQFSDSETDGASVLNSFAELSMSAGTEKGNASFSEKECVFAESISYLPKPSPTPSRKPTPTELKTPSKKSSQSSIRPESPSKQTPFLNKYSNDRAPVFDTERRLDEMEQEFSRFKDDLVKSHSLKDSVDTMKSRINELEAIRAQITSLNDRLQSDLEEAKARISSTNIALDEARRSHTFEVDDLRRKYRNEMDDMREQHSKELDRSRRANEDTAEKVGKEFEKQIEQLLKVHKEELEDLRRKLREEQEDELRTRTRELQEIQSQCAMKIQNAGLDLDTKEKETQNLRGELLLVKSELDRERALKANLQDRLTEASGNMITMEGTNKAMQAKIHFLESDSQAQSQEYVELNRRMQEAIEAAEIAHEKLRQEETLRRKLHNQVQELKGNIRVMCRVRPLLGNSEPDPAKIEFPDCTTDSKEVSIQGPETRSALGNVTTATYLYSFDRVFGPSSQNGQVFEEISQLVQSALDGYNVCIFCYGQTGSGKTFTMTSADGMIPRAVQQIWSEATRLEEKGWKYKMEGSFVEVYNENLNDLLGKSEDLDKKKLEIRHDAVKKQTILENAATVELDGPARVEEILERASKNRSVAATKANSRSSRSHSVFILKLVGENSITGERSEGTLNLVDLAGSERLEHSKAEGARLKETQNINKSLSCLGDVINALGSAKEGSHIPYRNSKLTYLLQYSLGGNSKTLMFVMVSPLQAHLHETVTSLKFATKVHNTHIGTAKKQTKTRD